MTRIDQSARESHHSTRTASWASGSLAVVLPVRGAPAGSQPIGPRNPLWTLRSSTRPTTNTESPISIDEARLAAMRSGVGYVVVQGRGLKRNRALVDAFPQSNGCLVQAIEIFSYDDVEVMSYVVLHIVLTAPTLDEMAERVTWFVDPGTRSEQASRRWSHLNHHALLRALGFDSPTRRRPDDVRPFVISHLVPDGRSAPELATEEVPDGARRSDESSSHPDGYWLGSTWCRASRAALALIETRRIQSTKAEAGTTGRLDEQVSAPTDRHLEPAVLEGFAHHEAVDLVILAMRQSAFLARHAEALANAWDIELDSAPTTLTSVLITSQGMREQALGFDERLAGFRRDLWLDFEDGDEAVHQTFTSVQSALGLRTRLHEVESEQSAITEALIGSADHISRRVAERYGEIPTEKSFGLPLRTQLVESALFVIVALGMTHAASQVRHGDSGPAPYFWVALLVTAGAFLGLWAVGRIVVWRTEQRGD
ncbi:hypothetical protein GCM10027020_19240 [Nocardioides salsibiostraticola]